MPIERDSIISIPSVHLRPSMIDNGHGVLIPGGPDTVMENCIAGVIPESIESNVYHQIGGGPENLLKWLLVVRGAPTMLDGDAVHVLQGKYAGIYRIQVLELVPNETFLLAQCIRES